MRLTIEDLTGRWRVRRRIEDRLAGAEARLDGVANFARDGSGLTYREGGRLTLPGGQVLETHRCYRWRFGPGDQITVHFEDGRPFHHIDATAPERQVVHPCGEDLYRGHYGVEAGWAWSSVWEVKGPRKDQRLVTTYRRL